MKDRRQIAHEAAYRAQSEGQSINGIAEAVMQLVLEKIALAWQPIETAPKDGEDMILLLEDESWLIGYWHEGAQTWDTSAGWAKRDRVTHWMRPAPPQPNSGGALAGDGTSTT